MPALKSLKLALLIPLLALGATAHAQPLNEVLDELLQTGPRMAAVRGDVDASRAQARLTSRRAWTPNLEFSAEMGSQRYAHPVTVNPSYQGVNRITGRATQLVYDFGHANAQIDEAEAVVLQASASAAATSEGLVLEALSAHWA